MERLRTFLHQTLDESRLRDGDAMSDLGVRHRWVPDELAAFDEVELATSLDDERDLILTLALEDGRVERILLGWATAGDDDEDMRAFDEETLEQALESRGETVVKLLSHLTGS